VNEQGEYEQTTDRDFLLRYFEIESLTKSAISTVRESADWDRFETFESGNGSRLRSEFSFARRLTFSMVMQCFSGSPQ
jgi:hypothetical protein